MTAGPREPTSIKSMIEIFLSFRLHEVALHYDLANMYHSANTGQTILYVRLMAWEERNNHIDPRSCQSNSGNITKLDDGTLE